MQPDRRGPAGAAAVLYVGAAIPKLSETFVYREIFALRALGVEIIAASVNPPEIEAGNEALERLAATAIPVYGSGAWALWRDAARSIRRRPGRAGVLGRGILDALFGRDVSLRKRPRIVWQCVAGLALAERLAGRDVGHVHAHMAHVPATIGMYTAAALAAPFSFTGHAVDLFAERTLLPTKLRRAVFVACISEWHRELYRSVAGARPPRLPIVRCGVDVGAIRPLERAPPTSIQVTTVGRMVPKKGFDLLLRALAILASQGLPFHATLVGDGPELANLRALQSTLGLADRVELTGALPNSLVLERVARADLFVLPCRIDACGDRDGIPVVLMEAMACGVPVIAGDIVTIRELVDDGESGFLVPPEDVDALATKIRDLATDQRLRAAFGLRGRQKIEAEFALEVNARRLLAALESSGLSS